MRINELIQVLTGLILLASSLECGNSDQWVRCFRVWFWFRFIAFACYRGEDKFHYLFIWRSNMKHEHEEPERVALRTSAPRLWPTFFLKSIGFNKKQLLSVVFEIPRRDCFMLCHVEVELKKTKIWEKGWGLLLNECSFITWRLR